MPKLSQFLHQVTLMDMNVYCCSIALLPDHQCHGFHFKIYFLSIESKICKDGGREERGGERQRERKRRRVVGGERKK